MKKDAYVVVVGSLNYDIILKQDRLPKKGETFTADSVSFTSGGKGANQAVQCAKLGIDTYMIGKVGDDSFGEFLLQSLNQYHVDTDYVKKSPLHTGIGTVNVLKDGTVFATIATGANFDFDRNDIDAMEEVIKNCKLLILQLEIPVSIVEYIIEIASAAGVYIILNAAPAKPVSKEAISKVDCLVVNESEASFYAENIITNEADARRYGHELLECVKETVIITLGEQGSLLCEDSGFSFIPSVKVPNVVETTGAGDSYIGAFAYGKFHGKSNKEACEFASRVSSITVTHIGAQPAMPFLNEIK